MTLFVDMKPSVGKIDLAESKPEFGQYLGAVSADMWQEGALSSISRMEELNEAMYGNRDIASIGIDYMAGFDDAPEMPQAVDIDEQVQFFKDAGLEGHLKPHKDYTQKALEIIVERKKDELRRRDIRERAPMSYAPAGALVGFGTAMLDPLNVASAFIPVVGEARVVTMLGKASGGFARAGVRAGVGAVEGTAGALMLEPLVYAAKKQEQADYGMTEAMLNVGFGAFFGAGLHAGTGAVGDVYRARRGFKQPWDRTLEQLEPVDLTAGERLALTKRLQDAHPNLGHEEATATAAIFDARARTFGRDTLQDPALYYEQYAPSFIKGESVPEGSLAQAMYKGRESNVLEFVERVSKETDADKKSFYTLGKVSRIDAGLEDAVIDLPADTVRHTSKRHPDFMRWNEIVKVIEEGKVVDLPKGKSGNSGKAFILEEGKKAFLVLAEPLKTKQGQRIIVTTNFEDSTKRVKNWLKENKDATLYQHASGSLASPSPSDGNVITALKNGIFTETVPLRQGSGGSPANPSPKKGALLEQQSGSAHKINSNSENVKASVHFEAGGKAVVSFFENADASSAPHELFHIFRREFAETASQGNAPEHLRRDLQAIEDFLGVKSGEVPSVKMEEEFASLGEKYLLKGEAPSPALAPVFAKMKEWFTAIYAGVKDEISVSPAMKGVFDRMLDASEASDRALAYLVRGIEANPKAIRLKEAYAKLGPDERQDIFRVAVAQAQSGKRINVEGLVLKDAGEIARMASNSEASGAPLENVMDEITDANAEMGEALARLEVSNPEMRAEIEEGLKASVAEHDADIARLDMEERVLLEAINCDMKR